MKALRTIGLAAFLAVFLAGPVLAAQPPVPLGTAGTFAVLAGVIGVTNTGATTITGDVGVHPGTVATGFNTVTLHGTLHLGDAVALQAKSDLTVAYLNAAGRTPFTAVPTELGGTTLKAGVYRSDTLGLTGTLRLDGQGNPNAVFIFQSSSTLITASGSKVELINEASPCNVFWQITSSATIGTTSAFQGIILALTSITLQTGATLVGSALARNGAVTLHNNTISNLPCGGPGPTPAPSASASGSVGPRVTLPPTNTSGSQETGSGSSPSILLLLAGLAAGAAFVTIRQFNGIRR